MIGEIHIWYSVCVCVCIHICLSNELQNVESTFIWVTDIYLKMLTALASMKPKYLKAPLRACQWAENEGNTPSLSTLRGESQSSHTRVAGRCSTTILSFTPALGRLGLQSIKARPEERLYSEILSKGWERSGTQKRHGCNTSNQDVAGEGRRSEN